jgi:hypothetical protein
MKFYHKKEKIAREFSPGEMNTVFFVAKLIDS